MAGGVGQRPPKRDMENISAKLLDSGRWTFRVQLRYHGKQLSRNFGDVKAARRWRNKMKDQRDEGAELEAPEATEPDPEMPLTRYVDDVWWPQYAERRISEKTRREYARVYANWVVPYPDLAGQPIALINSGHVRRWNLWAEDEGAKDPTRRQALKVISGALRFAALHADETGVMGVPLFEWPEENRKHVPVIVDAIWVERVRVLLLRSHRRRGAKRNALLLSLMHQTGMRPSEARGLRVRDIDFGENLIYISPELSKTDKLRVVPLWKPLRQEILAWIELEGLGRSSYVCGKIGNAGEFQMTMRGWENWRDLYEDRRDKVANRIDAPALMETARAYDLCRHSHAAMLIDALIQASVIAQRMGHSEETLWRHYTPKLEARGMADKREAIDPEQTVIEARKLAAGE